MDKIRLTIGVPGRSPRTINVPAHEPVGRLRRLAVKHLLTANEREHFSETDFAIWNITRGKQELNASEGKDISEEGVRIGDILELRAIGNPPTGIRAQPTPEKHVASIKAMPLEPPPSARPRRTRRGIRNFFTYVLGIGGTIFIGFIVIVIIGITVYTVFKYDIRVLPGGARIGPYTLLAILALLGFVFARRHIRRSRENVEIEQRSKQANGKTGRMRQRRRGRQSFLQFLGSAILWITLLVLGGAAGWIVGGAAGEGGRIVGAFLGVLLSQVIQASLIRRRR